MAGARPRLAVVRALPGLGDLLCLVPALRALRRWSPGSHVTVVGIEQGSWLASRFPGYVDDWLTCPRWPGLVEIDGPADERFLQEARDRRFDVAIQAHGDGTASNALTAALGARQWVGLALAHDARAHPRPPRDGAAGRPPARLGTYRTDRHEVDRCLDAVRLVTGSAPADDDRALEFPLAPREIADIGRRLGPGTTVAVVHPGASVASRRWPAERFADVAIHLAQSVDAVVVTGTVAERPITQRVVDESGWPHRIVDTAGRLTLGELAALLSRAVVVVANDTGPAHLAAAVGTPTVTVCAGSEVDRWAPMGADHRAVAGARAGRWPVADEVVAAVDATLATVLGAVS